MPGSRKTAATPVTDSASHECPIAGQIPLILRELDKMQEGFRSDLKEQDDRLMVRIEERFGLKLQACEGLEETVAAHQARIETIERIEAEHRGERRVQTGWRHAILSLVYAAIGGVIAIFGHGYVKH